MKDFAPGGGIYKHMDRSQRSALGERLIGLINGHVEIGIASFAPEERFERRHGDEAYSFCLQHSMLLLDSLLSQKHGQGCEATVYFERGRKHSGKAVGFIEGLDDTRLQRFGSVKKEDCGMIQAADMITWHIAKYLKGVVLEGRGRPRHDCAELMKVPGAFQHIFPMRDGGISIVPFHNDGVSHPETMQKMRELYDSSIPIEALWSKYGAFKIG
jgi:hypothetical protein